MPETNLHAAGLAAQLITAINSYGGRLLDYGRMTAAHDYDREAAQAVWAEAQHWYGEAQRLTRELRVLAPIAAEEDEPDNEPKAELCSDKNGFHDGHDWTPDPCEPYRWCPGYPVPRAQIA